MRERLSILPVAKSSRDHPRQSVILSFDKGKVIVETRLTLSEEQGVAREIVRIARSFPGVETVVLKSSSAVDWTD